ncbi:MAG: DEAD/DEAH box helicase [Gammaproteobacteria bacterium]|nr:DEAD/DEAH box helicase [Gammaproteobacteria bacterium]
MFSPLNPKLQKTVAKLGFEQETEIQQKAIPLILDGVDLAASSETGSGKTAAYLLPILDQLLRKPGANTGTRCLILVPTRELARQVEKQFEQLAQFTAIKAGVLTGGASMEFQRAMLRKDPEVLIATPGRILDHSKGGATELDKLEYLVLDEADKMLDLGFSEDVEAISSYCNEQRQTLLFSATLNARGIKPIIQKMLNEPKFLVLNSFTEQQQQITQQIIPADDLKHKEKLVNWLLKNEKYRKAIIFCNTKAQVDRLGGLLKYHQHAAGTLHGDNSQEIRNQVMMQFRDNKFNVLVASDVAARGIDVKEVDLVINFDMAHNGEEYIHRIGRTGRAGESGLAISLISSREWNLMATIENFLKTKFEKRIIKALIGKYTGPKNLKSNGKAATKGKRNSGKKLTAREKKRLDKKLAKKDKPKLEPEDSFTSTKPKKKFGGISDEPIQPLRKK